MIGRNLLRKDMKEEFSNYWAGMSLVSWFESNDEEDFCLDQGFEML